MYSNLLTALKQNDIAFKVDEIMKNHTSFKIGGKADVFVTPDSVEKCCKVISLCRELSITYIVIGKGSNLLVSDDGIRGVVICISSALSEISLISEDTVYCQAGASLSSLCNFALENSLSGIEFAYGIPGNLGGAVVMNAGAYGGEMRDVVTKCEYIDEFGKIKTIGFDELDFSYRHSFFSNKDKCCIVGAFIKLKKGDKSEIRNTMTDLLNRRKEKQPLEYPSAGSTFKRPQGSYASMLVDNCGLKGFSVGGAQVSEKHAGFVINRNNATCDDVLDLMKQVSDIVYNETGYKLEPEVKII